MKLFAIRVENNEAVLVTAVSAEEALESVGLPGCLLLGLDGRAEGVGAHLTQQYKVIELNNLHLRFQCTTSGQLSLCDTDPATYECLFELYPQLKLAAMSE